MASNPLLYPNVGGTPGGVPISRNPAQARDVGQSGEVQQGNSSNFQQALTDILQSQAATNEKLSELNQNQFIKDPLKFSSHATARVRSRGIDVGAEQMRKLSEAVDKAASKGLDDTLILTKDAAFIVSVKNRTVVTAMDRSQLDGNVFTNIEGAIVVS